MKKYFAVKSLPKDTDIVLLLLRLVMGYAFIMHGLGKIQNPMAWMGPDSPMPGVFQLLAAVSEFGGGIALIIGLLTRLAMLGLAFTMAVAVYTHAVTLGDPFVSMTGERSYELAGIYLVLSILFVVCGPGRFSVDKKVFG